MVDTAVAVDVVRAAMCEYRKSFPDDKATVSNQVLILSTLEALDARGMAVVDRARFERLIAASAYAEQVNWKLANLQPGDLDPIP